MDVYLCLRSIHKSPSVLLAVVDEVVRHIDVNVGRARAIAFLVPVTLGARAKGARRGRGQPQLRELGLLLLETLLAPLDASVLEPDLHLEEEEEEKTNVRITSFNE